MPEPAAPGTPGTPGAPATGATPAAPLSAGAPGPVRRSVSLQLPGPLWMALRLAIVAIVVLGLYAGQAILVPLALAALLAFVLDPLVGRLRRLHLPRSVAVGIVTLATLSTLAGASLLVGQQVMQLGKDLPRYQSTIEHKLRALRQRIAGDSSLHSATRLIDSVGHEVDAARKALGDAGQATQSKATRAPPVPVPVQVAAAPVSSMKALHDALTPVLEPLLSGGIAVVLLIFILLERNDLRDRVMRLVGGDLHHMTDALNEAAHRVSRYLTMQVLVNAAYGVPLTLGLWWIGVPGALLWGLLAALLRFIPYLGPVLASAFPLALAFAMDPGWDMLLWTAALILTLELISNNLLEPWLYGSSTGLAPVAIVLSTAFWTVLWGTAGLILATPLTVCLVVMGRHLPSLRFLDLLLGSDPVFDAPTRLYQRLLAGSVEEASDMAESQIADIGLTAFYSGTALPALGMAAADHSRVASAEHRHRVATGMGHLLQEIRHDHPAAAMPDGGAVPAVLCIALRWEADALVSAMLAHALQVDGVPAQDLPAGSLRGDRVATLGQAGLGEGADGVVCLSSFHPDPAAMVQHACRRLQRLRPGLKIVLGLWHAPPSLREPGAAAALGATAVATSLQEAVAHVQALRAEQGLDTPATAWAADPDAAISEKALALCRQLDARRAGPSLQTAQRAAEIFDTAHGVVGWADDSLHSWQAGSQTQGVAAELLRTQLMRPLLQGAPATVVPDSARHPQLSHSSDGSPQAQRFVAAVPLRWDAQVVGMLCLLDGRPRDFSARELRLLEALASDLVQSLQGDAAAADEAGAPPVDRRALLPPLLPPGGAVAAG